jgi:biopolymer transport protein ExbB
MNLVHRLTSLADFGASWVMWLLIALSVVAIAVVIERAVLFFSSRDDITRLRDDLRQLLDRGQLEAARKKLEESPSFEARVAAAGLAASGAESAEARMQGETELMKVSLEKNLSLLGTLGNNAPFVGLLGTVIGIVRAFRELENSSAQVSAGLMAEVGEALVATAIGLLVALPAVAFFNFYQRVIRTRVSRAGALSHEILAFRRGEPLPTAAE